VEGLPASPLQAILFEVGIEASMTNQSGSPDFYFERFKSVLNGTEDKAVRIRFTLTQPADDVELIIYNRFGVVRKLYKGPCNAGSTEILWDMKNDKSASVGSGAYKLRLSVNGSKKIMGLVVIK
jgi:flagellar hook assembly protein FlgD